MSKDWIMIMAGLFFGALLTISWNLGEIARCMKWHIDYIRDPVRAKERRP